MVRKKAHPQKPPPKTTPKPPIRTAPPPRGAFPIVGVGASAGGLQAFLQLIEAIPADPGIAILFVLHTDGRDSHSLREVLARKSKLAVEIAAEGMPIAVNQLYVPPAGSYLLVDAGRIRLQSLRDGEHGLAIDACLHSLAKDQGSRAIAVVLSGMASDGALGARAVKSEGGITFAQDDSAESIEMPHNAVAAGGIDFVLAPREIAGELVRIAGHSFMSSEKKARFPDRDLQRVFDILHTTHDVDFTHYKPSTIERRIRRRMAMQRQESLDGYIGKLRDSPAEIEQLYNDILIRVTGFFRDPRVFEILQRDIVPMLLEQRNGSDPVRIWVPGCATGEEAYSLAMCFLEMTAAHPCPVQIFGTDISESAVERARSGHYPPDVAAEVSAERLTRFFTPTRDGYRVSKAVRDCCIFARQNVTKDPPFSRLDLISCRNLMIYLGTVLQRKVMSLFHYALRPDGVLILGSSETIGNFSELFNVVDRKNKIYSKKASPGAMPFALQPAPHREPPERPRLSDDSVSYAGVFHEADRLLLSRYTPPGVLINDEMEIVQFRGRTSAFLEPAPGAATFNLLKMAREGLAAELRTAIHAARKSGIPARRDGVSIGGDGVHNAVNVEVLPFLTASGDYFFMVLFEEVIEQTKGKGRRKKAPEPPSRPAQRLKRELEATREYLQSIIEEQEAMNEELRSANDESQSSNEELQSTNEELETAKEELQSSNEELTTLNEELENRYTELSEVNNDLLNLLTSVEIPIVMLDGEMRIRRFNPGAQRALNLIGGDMGRSIRDLKSTLLVEDIDARIQQVVDTLEVCEMQVQHRNGQWYSMRIRPYKTTENKIEGVVLILVDIDEESGSPKRR
jgi:two-component system CheB/CheR fusion protein